MPIKVACQCGASFAAKDELAGKAVRCPKCQKPLRIPAAAPAPAPVASSAMDDLFDEVGIEQKHGPTCPQCGAELKPNAVMCVACGVNFESGERASGHVLTNSAEGHEAATQELLGRAERQIQTDKEDVKKNNASGQPAYVYLFGLIMLVVFAGMMFTMPKGIAFQITGACLWVFAATLAQYYQIRHLIVAFHEGIAQGLFHFIPFFGVGYYIYYMVTRWDKVGMWFMKWLTVALPIAMLGGVLFALGLWIMTFKKDPGAWDFQRPHEMMAAPQVAALWPGSANELDG